MITFQFGDEKSLSSIVDLQKQTSFAKKTSIDNNYHKADAKFLAHITIEYWVNARIRGAQPTLQPRKKKDRNDYMLNADVIP